MKGMTTCKICGREFALMIEEHYVARGIEKKGIAPIINGMEEAPEYDAFDCPYCGCQNIAQERKPVLFMKGECPCEYGICDECDHPGEEEQEKVGSYVGCDNCKHESCDEDEKPCVLCSHRYMDRWEAKDE